MASRGLGSLTLDLIAKIGGFTEPLGRAEREMDKRARAMESRAKALQGAFTGAFGTIAAGIGGFVAGVASVNAVFEGFKGAVDAADRMDELSARLDISTEKLSTWAYAAKLSGTSLDDLTAALPKLAKNMTEALDASSKSAGLFKALGISVLDSAGKLRAVQDVLPEVADKFRSLDNSTLEASLSMELFGKSGTGLLEFLNRGSDGIAELEQHARDLGIEIDGNTASAAAEFKDKLDDLRAATQGLFTQLSADLLPELTKLVQWAVEFTRDGSNAKNVADSLSTAFSTVGTVTSVLSDRLDGVGKVIEGLTVNFYGLKEAIAGAFTLDVQKVQAAVDLFSEARRLIFGGAVQAAAGSGSTPRGPFVPAGSVDFSNVVGGSSSVRADPGLEGDLGRFFGGDPKKSGRKARAGGKSDAERDAEALKKEIDSLNESLSRQIALYGQTTEVAKVRYDIEHGELAKATKEQQADLLLKAQRLDLLKAEDEETQRRADLEREQGKRFADMLADLRFENELLGKTIEQKAVLNALRYAGVDAASAEGVAISEATKAFLAHEKEVRTTIELMDDFREGASNAIYDFVTGAESMKDAIKDFADDFARQITKLIADRWIEKLFGQMGSNGSGSSGGDWLGTIVGAVFGSGKVGSGHANGGPVAAGMLYPVNERGTELLSVGGRDFLMMGAKGGHITPNHMLGRSSGPPVVNQIINVQGLMDRRTPDQIATQSGRAMSRAMARNR